MNASAMNRTWLVQRLRLPPRTPLTAKASQVFGGGGLGLKSEAWNILQQIFDIDYMGAAEYEFGILPETLSALIADRKVLIAFRIVLKRDDVPPNPEWKWRGKEARRRMLAEARAAGKKAPRVRKGHDISAERRVSDVATLFAIGRREHRHEIEKRVASLVNGSLRTRDYLHLLGALDPITDSDLERCGWLELDNGFFFFTNAVMWRQTASLFGARHVLCGKYVGDNDATCPQLTCIRDEHHDGDCDNVRGDQPSCDPV